MPEKRTIERARRDARQGKSASTQAGEFVREQIHHIRQGRHGARSTKQAIAIGLSEARRSGVKLPLPERGRTSRRTRRQAKRDTNKGRHPTPHKSNKRSRATTRALKREPRNSVSSKALSRQAKRAAANRTASDRSRAARKAAATRKRRGH